MELKLKLNEADVKRILTEWAESKFALTFDDVDFDSSYNSLRSATLTHKEPEAAQEGAQS